MTVVARAPGGRCGSRQDVTGTCCADDLALQGLRGGQRTHGQPHRRGGLGLDGGRAAAAGRGQRPCARFASARRSCRRGQQPALHRELTVVDSLVWAAEELLRICRIRARSAPLCSSTCSCGTSAPGPAAGGRRGVRREVVVPDDAGCCAFAGDRGMLHHGADRLRHRAEAAEVTAGTSTPICPPKPDVERSAWLTRRTDAATGRSCWNWNAPPGRRRSGGEADLRRAGAAARRRVCGPR